MALCSDCADAIIFATSMSVRLNRLGLWTTADTTRCRQGVPHRAVHVHANRQELRPHRHACLCQVQTDWNRMGLFGCGYLVHRADSLFSHP